MNILKMAWRNVWRNHRRSWITIAAMALALAVELIYSGVLTGMIVGMEDDVTAMESGDLQVFVQGYPTRPSLYDAVEQDAALLSRLDELGYPATARLMGGGLAASGDSSAGVALVGVDPARDAKALELHEAIAEGSWLDEADPAGVVVGRGLARTLDLKLGSELVVLSQSTDGGMANALYTVRGVLMSVAAGTDRSTVLMTEQSFRELMNLPEGAHRIIVRRPKDVPLEQARSVVAGLVAELPPPAEGERPLDVMTWKEMSPMLAQWTQSTTAVITIIYLVIYFAVAILILNAMLMAVFERIRELGVLKAIGFGPGRLLGMMLAEGLFQAAVAVVLGTILASPAMWYMQVHGIDVGALGGVQMVGMTMPAIWYGIYTVDGAKVPIIMLFFITVAATIYPALKAAWIQPVEAMHHQ